MEVYFKVTIYLLSLFSNVHTPGFGVDLPGNCGLNLSSLISRTTQKQTFITIFIQN
jgi:hypothetical protein